MALLWQGPQDFCCSFAAKKRQNGPQPVRWQQREPTEPPSNAFVERREESFGDSRRPWVILKNQPAVAMSSPWSGGAPFSENSTNLKKPRNTRRIQTTSGCLRPKPRLGTSGQLWLIKPMTMKPRSKHGPKLELSKANSRNGEDLTAHFGLDRFKPGPNGARTLSKAQGAKQEILTRALPSPRTSWSDFQEPEPRCWNACSPDTLQSPPAAKPTW